MMGGVGSQKKNNFASERKEREKVTNKHKARASESVARRSLTSGPEVKPY